jgi:hypothetical protein
VLHDILNAQKKAIQKELKKRQQVPLHYTEFEKRQ